MDPATVKTFSEPLWQWGAVGALIFVLGTAAWFFGRGLIACLQASAERQGAVSTAIEKNAGSLDKVSNALDDIGRRMERIERVMEMQGHKP